MRLRPYRRNLAMWNLHIGPPGRYGPLRPTRTKPFRRRLRLGLLLTFIGLRRVARAALTDWRPVAGAALTAAGVVMRSGTGGVLLLPGLLLLMVTLLVPASPKAVRARRCELERELSAYSTPAERRDLEAILDLYPDGETDELRHILAANIMAAGHDRIPGTRQ
jgi:hypothetical protein